DRHLDVAQQQIEPSVFGLGGLGGQPAIIFGNHLVTLHGQGAHHKGAHRGIIFGNQDTGHYSYSEIDCSAGAPATVSAAPITMPCPPAKLSRTLAASPGGRVSCVLKVASSPAIKSRTAGGTLHSYMPGP